MRPSTVLQCEPPLSIGRLLHVSPQDDADKRRHISAGSKESDKTASAKLRAMIVEDELLVAWELRSMLQELEIEVCAIASEGDEAFEKAMELHPDLILMDINLRLGTNGIDAARRVLEKVDSRIVFVTAYGDAATRAKIEEAAPGAPVVLKPASRGSLRAAIFPNPYH